MLASRDPVYSELTALTAGSDSDREGLAFHDWCDCKAVLVVKSQPWEGEQQFKQLQDLWDDARDNPTDEELEQELYEPRDRFAKRYSEALAEAPQQFAAFDSDSPADDLKTAVVDNGYPTDEGRGAGLAGSIFENQQPDGSYVLPERDGLPERRISTLYGRDLDEYPCLEQPDSIEEAAAEVSRVQSRMNCVRATAAAVMRMKGYDIYPYATLFASSKDGLQILDALDMWEVDGDPVKVMQTTSENWKAEVEKLPDGYGLFSFEIDGVRQRHVILWEREKGQTIFWDPQNGTIVDPELGTQTAKDRPVVIARFGAA